MHSIFGQSLLQSAIYIALSVREHHLLSCITLTWYIQIVFAGSSAILVKSYAP